KPYGGEIEAWEVGAEVGTSRARFCQQRAPKTPSRGYCSEIHWLDLTEALLLFQQLRLMSATSERRVAPHPAQSLVAPCPRWCKALPDSGIESDRGWRRVGPACSRQKSRDPADSRCQA